MSSSDAADGIVMDARASKRTAMRFRFGRNWKRYLADVDSNQVKEAVASLVALLNVQTLDNRTFLDIGCGSGLFSLGARRLGADVFSFDFDMDSVDCAKNLKNQYFPDDPNWRIEEGSVLDTDYMDQLGQFDIVYAWGVLHHTGDMWRAMEHCSEKVAPNGKLVVAIYNDQGLRSQYWYALKWAYNRFSVLRPALIAIYSPYFLGLRYISRLLRGNKLERGMSLWYDMIDWLGGFPFETAKPEQVVKFFIERDFQLTDMATCGGRAGCNEFVFSKCGKPRPVLI